MSGLPLPANVPRRIHSSLATSRVWSKLVTLTCPKYEYYVASVWYGADGAPYVADFWTDQPTARFSGRIMITRGCLIPTEEAPAFISLFLSADRGSDPTCQSCPLQLTCLGESTVH